MEQAEKPRRNYIRRKRRFNDCTNLIAKTLCVIKQTKGEPFSEASIKQLAVAYASKIEAACWTPRSKMTDDEYQALTNAKSCELCCAILREALKTVEQSKMKVMLLRFVQSMSQNGVRNSTALPKQMIQTESKIPNDPPQLVQTEPQKSFGTLLDSDLPEMHLPETIIEPLEIGYPNSFASLDEVSRHMFLDTALAL